MDTAQDRRIRIKYVTDERMVLVAAFIVPEHLDMATIDHILEKMFDEHTFDIDNAGVDFFEWLVTVKGFKVYDDGIKEVEIIE